jgi:hypothetical protein
LGVGRERLEHFLTYGFSIYLHLENLPLERWQVL